MKNRSSQMFLCVWFLNSILIAHTICILYVSGKISGYKHIICPPYRIATDEHWRDKRVSVPMSLLALPIFRETMTAVHFVKSATFKSIPKMLTLLTSIRNNSNSSRANSQNNMGITIHYVNAAENQKYICKCNERIRTALGTKKLRTLMPNKSR